ncbi:MAG: hypothetical protein PW789_15525 [Edaphobacter sp.]|uniref:hypothetical protein n=1 Tax=Edaphobacter sp. TaxID=1934404 RepID=UPI0023888A36|nr:hypothetical protein [Edaphobacter sp.]MDE1177989.1 hypothetical protein [Edaphobacter sp.]
MPSLTQRAITLVVALATFSAPLLHAAAPHARNVSIDKLPPNTRSIFDAAMKSMDDSWDADAHLVRAPTGFSGHADTGRRARYMVRETSNYALGLLMRDGKGDRERAADALNAVLKEQFLDQSTPWYGTFRRTPEEPDPAGEHTVMWANYDPNWRVFIGTTFELILIEYPERIPASVALNMYKAIDTAITGEMKQGRLKPSYSNIALMYGALWDFAANHDNNDEWKQKSSAWIREVSRLYHLYNSFEEYNSPTYYGTDLFGLALWRSYGSTAEIREAGRNIEGHLWDDIADFYQPGLRNIAGPYDRSYGMDMETYVAYTGVWMRALLPADKAPLPIPDANTDHLGDLWFAPHIAVLGANPSAAALAKMTTFSGEHMVRRQITDDRSATAWIGNKIILGGEDTKLTKDAPHDTQFHPATAQWRIPTGSIGWFYVWQSPKINVDVDHTTMTIATDGTITIRLKAEGTKLEDLTATKWTLPGLTVAIEGDQKSFDVKPSTYYKEGDSFVLTYTDMHKLKLTVTPQ